MKLMANKNYPKCKILNNTKDGVIGLTYEGKNIIFGQNDIFEYNGTKYKMIDRLNYVEYISLWDKFVLCWDNVIQRILNVLKIFITFVTL